MQHYPHYAETMPAQLQAVVEDIAQTSKDAPWFAAYTHMRCLGQLAVQAFPDDYSASSQLHGCLVAAVLELMGADPRRVNEMQDLGEQRSGDSDFCELECGVAAMATHPGNPGLLRYTAAVC